jgi:hypothetical protein
VNGIGVVTCCVLAGRDAAVPRREGRVVRRVSCAAGRDGQPRDHRPHGPAAPRRGAGAHARRHRAPARGALPAPAAAAPPPHQ